MNVASIVSYMILTFFRFKYRRGDSRILGALLLGFRVGTSSLGLVSQQAVWSNPSYRSFVH